MNLENTNNPISFKRAKIDSLTLLIPLQNVEIVSSTFNNHYTKVYIETGEVLQSYNENKCELEDQSFYEGYIKTEDKETATFLKYKKVERLFNSLKKLPFIQIMITSKQLLCNYFDGINKENIKFIYDRIINDGVIKLTFEDFLKAYVSDIDICKDYQVKGIVGFKQLKESLYLTSLIEKRSFITSKNANSKELFGLMYNDRVKANNANPFCKLYFKTSELDKDKSNGENKPNFKDVNLKNVLEYINGGIARIEVTIKASKHKSFLGIDQVKTLNDLLIIDEVGLNRIFLQVFNQYYNPKQPIEKAIKNKESMSPKDLMLSNAIEFILQNNNSITTPMLVRIMQNNCLDKDKKSTIKKYTLEIVEVSNNRKTLEKNDLKASNSIEILKDLEIFE